MNIKFFSWIVSSSTIFSDPYEVLAAKLGLTYQEEKSISLPFKREKIEISVHIYADPQGQKFIKTRYGFEPREILSMELQHLNTRYELIVSQQTNLEKTSKIRKLGNTITQNNDKISSLQKKNHKLEEKVKKLVVELNSLSLDYANLRDSFCILQEDYEKVVSIKRHLSASLKKAQDLFYQPGDLETKVSLLEFILQKS